MALRGIDAVEFQCPACSTRARWGSHGMIGFCRGWFAGGADCTFRWNRRHDYTVFVHVDTGEAFASAAALAAVVDASPMPAIAGVGRPTFVECLHELLLLIMVRPPTLAAVNLWSMQEQRDALFWASGEVLYEEGAVEVVRRRRPTFIEDGAATA